ncbi:MAG: TolC family protein [Planctomycetota bacterium]
MTTMTTATIMTMITDRGWAMPAMMLNGSRSALGLCAVLAVGGCGYRGPFADWIDDERAFAENSEVWLAKDPEVAAAGTRGQALMVADDVGPDDFVRLALERNPAIKAAEQRVHRLANRIPQVTSFDDPMVMVAPFGEMAETAAGQVGVMTGVSQKVPFPGKLETRGRVAAQDVAEAVQELQRVRLEVISDARRAWWSFYYSTRAIEVTERNRELLRQFRDSAEARYRAGTATQQDVLRASVEMSNLDNELIALGQRQTTARAMLNRLMDRPIAAALPLPGVRGLDSFALQLGTLLDEAQELHPSIRRIRERVEGFRQRLELAKLNRWPDLTVSFNYNLVDSQGLSGVANGEDQWWVGFGINVPIWAERLDAAEYEATRGVLQNIAALGDARNRITFRVQDALARVESEQQQAVLFRDVIVPQARQTVDASLSGYRSGKLEFLTLVDNWRKYLDFQLMYHRSVSRLEQSFAELQEAVGQDLPRRSPAEGAGGSQDAADRSQNNQTAGTAREVPK